MNMDTIMVNMSLLVLLMLTSEVCGGQIPDKTKGANNTMKDNRRWRLSATGRCGRHVFHQARNKLDSSGKYVYGEPQDEDTAPHADTYMEDMPDLDRHVIDVPHLYKRIDGAPHLDKYVDNVPAVDTYVRDLAHLDKYVDDESDLDKNVDDEPDLNKYVNDEPDLDKILGGHYAGPGEIPWQVNVKVKRSYRGRVVFQHFCGGALISEFYILTAAQCIYGKMTNQIKVVVGDHHLGRLDYGEQEFGVEMLIIHENYTHGKYVNDIALIKVKSRNVMGVHYNNFVMPVCLPINATEIAAGTPMVVAGWGLNNKMSVGKSNLLKRTEVPLVTQDNCKQLYKRFNITPLIFCAGFVNGHTDICYGDEGGPAVYKTENIFVLYGIVSYCTGCLLPNYPSVFTRVSAYLSWIQRAIMHYSDTAAQESIPTRPKWFG